MTEKLLDVRVDASSWEDQGKNVPIALADLERRAPIVVSFENAMMFLALLTRPPAQYGFSLSDTWAWLRYFPAVAASQGLRLREEWTGLDPHHKTILSGDFGVGFTALLLSEALSIVECVDTLHMVNVLAPGQFILGRSAKRGPDKAPDYICVDNAGTYHILECKGSQTSHAGLEDSLNRGVQQKQNVNGGAGVVIGESVVAGLFIPQWENSETALLHVRDPEWNRVKIILSEYSRERVNASVGRIALAKELAMLELSDTANALSYPEAEQRDVRSAFSTDLSRAQRRGKRNDLIVLEREYIFPAETRIDPEGPAIDGVRFSASLPADAADALLSAHDPEEVGQNFFESNRSFSWQTPNNDGAGLVSPAGVHYRIS